MRVYLDYHERRLYISREAIFPQCTFFIFRPRLRFFSNFLFDTKLNKTSNKTRHAVGGYDISHVIIFVVHSSF